MKFLIIGDIVGDSGIKVFKKNLKNIVTEENIDFIIVNAENATQGRGIKERELNLILEEQVDVITMGNHLYYRKEAKELYKTVPNLLIPENVLDLEGKGHVIINKKSKSIAVVNLIGKVYMGTNVDERIDSPFKVIKQTIEKLKKQNVDYIFIDFHAEATAEKIAMANFLKNDVTCIFGTHTHVQTADEKIFDTGMAYITDIGMTGPIDSVLGLKTEIAVNRFVTGEKIKYECSNKIGKMHYIIIETDDKENKCISINRYARI